MTYPIKPPQNTLQIHHKNHRYCSAAGPSLNNSVDISFAFRFTPSFLSLLLLSTIIHAPSNNVNTNPHPPKAAVVAKAGKYFGASCGRKMLLLTTPIRLAMGTATPVKTTRRFSSAILLLYHTSSMTLGADVPHVIMKHAK